MSQWTEDECRRAIAAWVDRTGEIPTRRELDGDLRLPPSHTLRRYWGSTADAFRAIGYEPWPPGLRRSTDLYWTAERCIASVASWIASHDGELPRSVDFNVSDVLPPQAAIRRRFGSMRALWRALGVTPPVVGKRRDWALRGERNRYREANRQMVQGIGLNDSRPGSVKHFGPAR